ncbi:GDSL-type esterase/lipase family protein [Marinilabilia salmonicolor]|uniref:GDSL-type esterase/lipase family protein n=1 Tax=Marinilabilia salmonicolor TaxID=989 RepID=UPI00029A375D|nr:GDSL-type esterase/lipase family protein [Marinilabilia salmonicolor]
MSKDILNQLKGSRGFWGMVILLTGLSVNLSGQEVKVDTSYANNYYLNKRAMHEMVEVKPWHVVFLGNSITERGFWNEWFPYVSAVNRGIGGDNCWGVYARLDSILQEKPAVIFLMIGINDLGRGLSVGLIASKYEQIIQKVKRDSPGTRLVLQTVLPINESTISYDYMKDKTSAIKVLNEHVRGLGRRYDLQVIDLYRVFAGNSDQLPEKFCVDGLHLNEKGYQIWIENFQDNKVLCQ